jgi:hypothetical protein
MQKFSKLKNELSGITDTLKTIHNYPPTKRKIIQEECCDDFLYMLKSYIQSNDFARACNTASKEK